MFLAPTNTAAPVRLARLIIAKLAVDILFITAIVTGFSYAELAPSFRGWLDGADAERVIGWAAKTAAAGGPAEVQLYIDGRFVGHAIAELPRPDVNNTLPSVSQNCGYEFIMPRLAPGEHEARVFAVYATADGIGQGLRQVGPAMRFSAALDQPRSDNNYDD